MPVCSVCFRQCELQEGQTGFCGARVCRGGGIRAGNYGKLTGLALDPIEKKPLAEFYPGSMILSVGSYGCNLRCPFCQNHDISWSREAFRHADTARQVSPEELAQTALYLRSRGNIGLAYTYNEPLIGWEFVRDTAELIHDAGLKNVLVTNGTADLKVLEALLPRIDAMNIDLKGFTDRYYTQVLGGSLEMVKKFIARAVQGCHVELTTLVVPGENDSEEEIRAMTAWISSLTDAEGNVIGNKIPLHLTRFFPRFRYMDRRPTDITLLHRLADVAKEKLKNVYLGNC